MPINEREKSGWRNTRRHPRNQKMEVQNGIKLRKYYVFIKVLYILSPQIWNLYFVQYFNLEIIYYTFEKYFLNNNNNVLHKQYFNYDMSMRICTDLFYLFIFIRIIILNILQNKIYLGIECELFLIEGTNIIIFKGQ